MPYEYLEDIAISDVAFEATGETAEEMFVAAARATMNVMVADLNAISPKERRMLQVESDSLEMLLFDLLQELIYYKDAERILLYVTEVRIHSDGAHFRLEAEAYGEELDQEKHDLVVDVKAVTLHRYRIEETPGGWKATIILDI